MPPPPLPIGHRIPLPTPGIIRSVHEASVSAVPTPAIGISFTNILATNLLFLGFAQGFEWDASPSPDVYYELQCSIDGETYSFDCGQNLYGFLANLPACPVWVVCYNEQGQVSPQSNIINYQPPTVQVVTVTWHGATLYASTNLSNWTAIATQSTTWVQTNPPTTQYFYEQ